MRRALPFLSMIAWAIACGGTGSPAQPTRSSVDPVPTIPTAAPTTTAPACAPFDGGSIGDAGADGATAIADAACE